ncbi:MAG: hypothetical protein JHC95_07810 [Solirubrobacteraceae bacterium]|nr:hypothetical protein [Solirubrobacteraceae bacterium]
MSPRLTPGAALAAAALLCAAPPAAPAQTAPRAAVASGQTVLTLNAKTLKRLRASHVSVRATAPSTRSGRRVTLAVDPAGSALDPKTFAGALNHAGGLLLTARGRSLALTGLVASVGRSSSLTAVAGAGARTKILSLATRRAKVTRKNLDARLRGVSARLTSAGAKVLNQNLGVRAFRRGQTLGTLSSQAAFAEAIFTGGTTGLAFDAAAVSSLRSLGVTLTGVAPATLTGATASFPITGGQANITTLAGSITHSGGLSLTAGPIRTQLTNFDIRAPQLLLQVNDAAAAPAIDLDTSAAKTTVSGRKVTVSDVSANLSVPGAAELARAFGVKIAPVKLGTLTVRGQAR